MKTRLFLIIMLFSFTLAGAGQNIRVTFSGTSTDTVIDSVTATNQTTDESITLPGEATLILTSNTGISNIFESSSRSLVYPNPFSGQATIQTFLTEYQNVNFRIMDLSGRTLVSKMAYMEPGRHQLNLSLSTPGIYLATIETSKASNTCKLVCTESSSSGNTIHLKGSNPQPVTRNPQLKSSFSLGYTTGDIVQYECFSGNFRTVFTDSPTETKNYDIEFPPIAQLNINPVEGTNEDRITLDATDCMDAETPAEELEVRWDFDGDSIWDTEFDQTKYLVYMFPLAGTFNVGLQVKDLAGMTDSVSVPINISYPTFTDSRDNNVYHYKKIGNQFWMVDNLAYLPEVSPSNEGSFYTKHYYVYGYESSTPIMAKQHPNFNKYGVLYNWLAALDACPEGWHLPGDDEWKILELELGMSEDDIDIRIGGQVSRLSGSVGGQLKEEGMTHWDSPNYGATNSSGFTAFGSGARAVEPDKFDGERVVSTFWTSTEFEASSPHAYFRQLLNSSDGVIRYTSWTKYGFSVRCIKD